MLGFRPCFLEMGAHIFGGRQDCLANGELWPPAQRPDFGAVQQNKRAVANPTTFAASVCDLRMKAEIAANPADRVLDFAVLICAEIEDIHFFVGSI